MRCHPKAFHCNDMIGHIELSDCTMPEQAGIAYDFYSYAFIVKLNLANA